MNRGFLFEKMALKKETISITLQHPSAYFAQMSESVKKITELFALPFNSSRQIRMQINRLLTNLREFKLPQFNKKNIFRILLPVIVIIAVLFGLRQVFNPGSQVAGTNISIQDTKPLAIMALNRSFDFPLRDGEGEEVGKLSYTIKDAELRKQIIVKGKRATAVEGRIFLILNLKIVNSLNQGLEVNSRDYIRFTVNGNTKELFAPDIHNDPVEVQAISTKNTRVGIAINETDKNIELRVGEINGKKEIIPVSF